MYITSIDGYTQILAAFISIISASSAGRKPDPYPSYLHVYCGANEIPCRSGTACIDRLVACDGIYHCPDGSDETAELCGRQECPWYMFRCQYGGCTRISSICNGVYDCVDKSDEPPYHSCRLNDIPPIPTGRPTMVTKSTTKHYTPFVFPVTTTSSKYPHTTGPQTSTKPYTSSSTSTHQVTHAVPSSTKTSTTKHYTPFTFSPSSEKSTTTRTTSAITQSTTKVNPPSPVLTTSNPRYTTQPTSSPRTSTTEKASTSPTPSGSCKLPTMTSDRTYTVDGCEFGSSDPVCQKKPGESIMEGVALNFVCNYNAKSFTSYCVKGDWIPSIDSCESDCGNLTANLRANTHIPWQVGIYDKSSDLFTCEGVIISPYAIVSAAHCFFDTTTNSQRSQSEFYVTVGKKSRQKNGARPEIYNITEIRFSPDGFQGSSTNFMGDIVLLEVTPMIFFSPEVRSCCFDSNSDQYSKTELAGVISDYNDNGGNGYTETTRVTFTSYEKCVQLVEDKSKPLVTSDKICLIGHSIEQGNGGNGLYTSKGGTSQYSQYRLRGIFSTTFYDSKSNGQVSTLTDIGKHLSWLPKALNEISQSHENETLIDVRGPFTSR